MPKQQCSTKSGDFVHFFFCIFYLAHNFEQTNFENSFEHEVYLNDTENNQVLSISFSVMLYLSNFPQVQLFDFEVR